MTKSAYAPLAAATVVAVLMIWALRDMVPVLHLALWSAALFSIYGLRLALFSKPGSYTHVSGFRFLPLFTGLTFCSGLVWGIASVLFFDPGQAQTQTLLAFCLGGLVAGSVVSYASWLPAFAAFAVPALVPLIVQLIMRDDEVQFVMGVMLLIYAIALAVLARTINRTLLQSQALQSALGNSEGRFRGVFATSPAGMVLMRLDGEIVMANRAFSQLLGYTGETLSGRNWREITHPDDIAATELLDERIISGDLPDLLVEKRYLHKAGHALWTDVATCLIDNPREQDSYLLRQVFDITALKSVERLKREFVSTVSHELRTPLTSIEGALSLILGGVAGQIPEPVREMTVLARKNSLRLIELVNDLLDIDQLESNDLPFAFDLIDMNRLVIDCIGRNKGLADKAGVALHFEPVDSQVQALGDWGRLGQVLTNLLSNAVKFSPRSDTIEVVLERIGSILRVSVTDNGPGIPDGFRATIFNRFSQADSSDTRAKGGAGLGLNISKAIMDKHAGKLSFVSVPGKGATFYMELQEWKGTEPINNAIDKLRFSGLRPGR
ncbi:MAG: PAS domain S-box protein [Rhodospirillales bacterium]|nr:PAS domain S-box protein [Rhodospirillales bacterium]